MVAAMLDRQLIAATLVAALEQRLVCDAIDNLVRPSRAVPSFDAPCCACFALTRGNLPCSAEL